MSGLVAHATYTTFGCDEVELEIGGEVNPTCVELIGSTDISMPRNMMSLAACLVSTNSHRST